MKIRVETEKKYYCLNPKEMIEKVLEIGFIEKSNIIESDEYFTDINSEFIKNRTCLRIRKIDNKKMEITFKGKSTSLSGLYCKLENNINSDINEYDNIVNLFVSLGYYSYVNVEKERLVYEKKDGIYNYSIMIDKLTDLGGFVEFEILADQEYAKKDELKIALRKLVNNFESLHLKEETRPYRDVVANYIYNKHVNNNSLNNIYINIDDSIKSYEKDFFKKYKKLISTDLGFNIKWGYFKKCDEINSILDKYVDEYLENLIFDSKELLIAIELLEKMEYNKCYMTKINEIFFNNFFEKINIKLSNVIYVEDESNKQLIKKYNIDLKGSIILNGGNLKDIISLLLIIQNNK